MCIRDRFLTAFTVTFNASHFSPSVVCASARYTCLVSIDSICVIRTSSIVFIRVLRSSLVRAVSYTHLDVYKRQVYIHFIMKLIHLYFPPSLSFSLKFYRILYFSSHSMCMGKLVFTC